MSLSMQKTKKDIFNIIDFLLNFIYLSKDTIMFLVLFIINENLI